MRILITCKEFPHSKVIGGPIIIYNRLKYLSKNHLVSLAAFACEGEERYIPSVKPFCHDLRLVPFPPQRSFWKAGWDFFFSPIPPYFLRNHGSRRMAREIALMVRKDAYDFVIAEYSVMGQYIHNNPDLPPVRRVISVHECYYLARLKAFHHHRWGLKKIQEAINLKGLKTYEFEMYRKADKVLTLTPEGKRELLEICPELDISIVPHGVDVDYFSFHPLDESEKSLVFVGNYLHYPNVDAVLYFHRAIWPLIKSRFPDMKFYIVGQSPPVEVESLSLDPSIIVTGKVADVRPFLKKGRIFICPVTLGGGFRGKILEAMAAGRPVVSTSLGSEGIPAVHGENILIADEPQEFAKAVAALIDNPDLAEKLGRNARKLMEEQYAWEKGVQVLERILEKMMEKEPLYSS